MSASALALGSNGRSRPGTIGYRARSSE